MFTVLLTIIVPGEVQATFPVQAGVLIRRFLVQQQHKQRTFPAHLSLPVNHVRSAIAIAARHGTFNLLEPCYQSRSPRFFLPISIMFLFKKIQFSQVLGHGQALYCAWNQ